jgi:hypothetical protein
MYLGRVISNVFGLFSPRSEDLFGFRCELSYEEVKPEALC